MGLRWDPVVDGEYRPAEQDHRYAHGAVGKTHALAALSCHTSTTRVSTG
jgi:hypothetical protein